VTVGQNLYCTDTKSYVKVVEDIDGSKFICKILKDSTTTEVEDVKLRNFVTLKVQLGAKSAIFKLKIDEDIKTQLRAIGGIDES
jgi:hypothetical protein